MIVFILIVLLEMFIYSLRGTKKNIIRLICNAGSAILAGGITFLIYALHSKTFSDYVSLDLTFGGNLSAKNAETLETILTSFAKGAIMAIVYSVIFLIIKFASLIIVKIIVKDDAPKGFKPLGLAFGFVSGLICAGFTLMPLTGLQQIFPDRSTAVSVSKVVGQYTNETTGKLVKLFSGPYAERTSRYTGIGLITDKIYNVMTTAKTDAGKECMADFAPPYLKKINDILAITEEDSLLSEKIEAGSKALEAFSETELFKEKEKVGMIEYAIQKNFPKVETLPEYKNISRMAKDVHYAGNIVEIIENAVPANKRNALLTEVKVEEIDVHDKEIEDLADNLYSMNEGSFYVNYILSLILGEQTTRISENDFEASKSGFVFLLKTAIKIKDAVNSGTLDYESLASDLGSLRASGLITRDDNNRIVNTIRENTDRSVIPDYILDYLIED